MSLSKVLKLRRSELGYTLLEIANKMGVSEATVQRWESGNIKSLRYERISQLANILEVSPAVLMGWEESPSDSVSAIPATGSVPVYGTIPAGFPAYAEQYIEDYLLTTVPNPDEYFALKVKGTSMINAGITDGCKVLVKKQNTAENGQIVVCRLNGDEATLKRFKQQGDLIMLIPENPEFEPRIVPAAHFASGEAEIIGIVKQIIIDL